MNREILGQREMLDSRGATVMVSTGFYRGSTMMRLYRERTGTIEATMCISMQRACSALEAPL